MEGCRLLKFAIEGEEKEGKNVRAYKKRDEGNAYREDRNRIDRNRWWRSFQESLKAKATTYSQPGSRATIRVNAWLANRTKRRGRQLA